MSTFPARYTTQDALRTALIEQHPADQSTIIHARDLGDLRSFAAITPSDWKGALISGKRNRTEWAGSESLGAAFAMLENGWPAGTAKMRKLTDKLKINQLAAEKIVYTYRGSRTPGQMMRLDAPAIIGGLPTPFRNRVVTKERGYGQKIVKIIVNVTTSAGVDTSVIEARGAAILALVERLETLRITTDITVAVCVNSGKGEKNKPLLCAWHVKPAGARINYDQLAFALVSPSSQRRIMFMMLEHLPETFAPDLFIYSGYGLPVPIVDKFPHYAASANLIIDSDCAFGDTGKKVEWTNPLDQVRWVKGQLQAQGIQLEN